MATSIKAEEVLGEIRYAGGYTSGLPITTTATGSFAAATVTGNFASNGNVTVGGTFTATGNADFVGNATINGTLSVTGASTFVGQVTAPASTTTPLVVGTAQVIIGALNQVSGPSGITAPTGSIFMSSAGGTGPATRAFINSNGTTGGWIAITTAS